MTVQTQPAPASSIEIRAELALIFKEVLGTQLALEEIDLDAPVLEFVNSSLLLMEGLRRVHERFGVVVPIRKLLEPQTTLFGLALHLERAIADRAMLANEPSGAPAPGPRLALRSSQSQVGFLLRYSNGSAAAYNEAVAINLTGTVQTDLLRGAIDEIGRRHDLLRASLNPNADVLEIHGAPTPLGLSRCSAEGPERRVSELAGQPFDTGQQLFRTELLVLSESEHVLVLVAHALLADRQSLLKVAREIARAYMARLAETSEEVGDDGARSDLVVQDLDLPAPDARAADEAYWRHKFAAGVPRLELPTDWPRPPLKSYLGRRISQRVPVELTRAIHTAPQDPYVLFLTACLLFAKRVSGQKHVLIGAVADAGAASGDSCVVRRQSMFAVTQPLVLQLVKQRAGSVINITSIAGIYGTTGQANYCAAKAGIIGFTLALSKELSPFGVRVNAVAPGFIQTDMLSQMDPTRLAELTRRVPLGRLGTPTEVAEVVSFLASDRAAYVTGQVLEVGGGLTI